MTELILPKLCNADISKNYRDIDFVVSRDAMVWIMWKRIYMQNKKELNSLHYTLTEFDKYITKKIKFHDILNNTTVKYEQLSDLLVWKELYKIKAFEFLKESEPMFIDLDALGRNVFYEICREFIIDSNLIK